MSRSAWGCGRSEEAAGESRGGRSTNPRSIDEPPRLTRARERHLGSRPVRDILGSMAGRPLRRARAAADASGEPVTSRLPRAGISPVAWRGLSPVEKLQALYGLSLEYGAELGGSQSARLVRA